MKTPNSVSQKIRILLKTNTKKGFLEIWKLKSMNMKSISVCVEWMYTLYKFHFLNGISEINQLFDDILIIWPAPVCVCVCVCVCMYIYIYIYIYIIE